MNGLLSTVPMAVLTESRTLFELGLVVVLAAAAPLIRELGVVYLILELAQQDLDAFVKLAEEGTILGLVDSPFPSGSGCRWRRSAQPSDVEAAETTKGRRRTCDLTPLA